MSYTYKYPRPAVTTDCLIFYGLSEDQEVLLIQRKKEPFQDMWALPGGFVEIDEDLPIAAARELEEETNISGVSLQQFRTYGKPGRDPRGRTISVVFWGRLAKKPDNARAGDDAGNLAWYPVRNLPPLAFDHLEIISEALTLL
jgi:8-oxo-dGTP diphosphatase